MVTLLHLEAVILESVRRYIDFRQTQVAFSVVTGLETARNSLGKRDGIRFSAVDPKDDDAINWITDVERAQEMYSWD